MEPHRAARGLGKDAGRGQGVPAQAARRGRPRCRGSPTAPGAAHTAAGAARPCPQGVPGRRARQPTGHIRSGLEATRRHHGSAGRREGGLGHVLPVPRSAGLRGREADRECHARAAAGRGGRRPGEVRPNPRRQGAEQAGLQDLRPGDHLHPLRRHDSASAAPHGGSPRCGRSQPGEHTHAAGPPMPTWREARTAGDHQLRAGPVARQAGASDLGSSCPRRLRPDDAPRNRPHQARRR